MTLALRTFHAGNPYQDVLSARFWASMAGKQIMRTSEQTVSSATSPAALGELLAGSALVDLCRDSYRLSALWQVRSGVTTVRPDVLVKADKTLGMPNHLTLLLGSDSQAALDAVSKALLARLEPPEVAPDDKVDVRFWYATAQGPQSHTRSLFAPSWSDIAANYADDARAALGGLAQMRSADDSSGRLILLHGVPGTGKTTAIRCIAKEWKPWATIEYVVDPERFFGDASYMISVLLQNNENSPDSLRIVDADGVATDEDGVVLQEHAPLPTSASGRWRLIVVEDAEEFVKPGSKAEVGQSVGRLLNLSDGLIGQGLRVLVMLTTNVPIKDLHPAMMRPGRCLANIEVPAMSAREASLWLGGTPGVTEPKTLAELYAESEDRKVLGSGMTRRIASGAGTYL